MMMEKEPQPRKVLKVPSWLLLVLVVAYTLVFEWRVIFELPSLAFAGNLIKAAIPVFCLALLLVSRPVPGSPALRRYLLFFAVFMAWGLLSCLLSHSLGESLVQWVKYLYRLFFGFFICLYLLKDEAMAERLMKLFVVIGVLAVLQYLCLEIADFNGLAPAFPLPTPRGGHYHGPLGILGHGWARVHFGDISFFRLYGFWLEPSTASGFLLATAFFSEALYLRTKLKRWRACAVACLLGGGATFSNTAYLAMGLAGLLEEAYLVKTAGHARKHMWKLVFFSGIIAAAVFGRAVVAKYYSDNRELRYLIGVRESVEDPYGGRFAAIRANLDVVSRSALTAVMGAGFRVPVQDSPYSSAAAPMQWLVFTGIMGLLILGLREAQLITQIWKGIFSSVYTLRMSQAWLAAFVSSLIYGDLMTPFYQILVAIIFMQLYSDKLREGGSSRAPSGYRFPPDSATAV